MTDQAKPQTLWGYPVVILDDRPEPSTLQVAKVTEGPRRILSADLIDGVCQLMDGKLQMVMTDHAGKKFKVRIELDPVEE